MTDTPDQPTGQYSGTSDPTVLSPPITEQEPVQDDSNPADRPQHAFWLTDRDQQVLAACCVLLVAMVMYFTWKSNYVDHSDILRRENPGVGYRIDINTASWPELTQLDGIGPALARRIVAERDEHGPFTSVDDLQRVDGIGPKTVEKNREWLKVVQRDE